MFRPAAGKTATRIATTVAAVLVLAGCTASQGAPAPGPDPDPTAAAAHSGEPGPASTPSEAPIRYVAMGDSFTAGPFMAPYAADGEECLRSAANYPALLAERLHAASFVDVSCSGAATRHLTEAQRSFFGEDRIARPQLAALTKHTDLVTVSISGNDGNLFASIVGSCLGSAGRCPRQFADPGAVAAKLASAEAVEQSLGAALERIHRRAPTARVVVVGYPTLLPASGRCAEAGFRPADYPPMRRIAAALNDSLRRAADAHDATYVDLAAASVGHDICAGPDAWVNGAKSATGRALAFHPFPVGMEAAADAIAAALDH